MLKVTQEIPMLKLTNRYVPDYVCPSASQPITENVYHITRNSKDTREHIQTYTHLFKAQVGAVEFKTLEDLEKVYEEE